MTVIELAAGDSQRTALEIQFRENWRKPSQPGIVLSIFKVYNPGWRNLEFQRYRQQLPNGGNLVQRYHGTTLLCDLGSGAKSSKLCQNEGCHLCCILRTGFKTSKARDVWQRFGKGIYTTATSGKSNDYIRSSSNRRAVLVCRVLAGNVFRTQQNMPTLDAPPQGYDSVSGEVGKALNFDETVVYTSKAILPDYMIVYTV